MRESSRQWAFFLYGLRVIAVTGLLGVAAALSAGWRR